MEVCNSLTTDSFLCALNRFLCSRGYSTEEIWSDHGKNLVGANNSIQQVASKLENAKIVNFLAKRGVQWRFSPPRSPHQSGVWEVMIREAKTLLRAVYQGNCYRTLNDEKFFTYVKEVSC